MATVQPTTLPTDGLADLFPMPAPTAPSRALCVLDEEPDLARGIPPSQQERARRASRASTLTWFPREQRQLPDTVTTPAAFGLLVLDGAAVVRCTSHGRTRAELLGPASFVRPWMEADIALGPELEVSWEVLVPLRMAVLDERFARAMAPWPSVAAGLMDRLAIRTRRLSAQMTASASPRGEDRVALQLWQLAEQWGRVTAEGVLLPMPLTHRLLGELTGSRRPTVTSAVVRLREEGALRTLPGHRFLLVGEPPRVGLNAAVPLDPPI